MGVGLERRAAPSAIAGRGRETPTAIRTELCVRFGTGTMGRARGSRERGAGSRTLTEGTAPGSPLPGLGAESSQGLRRVLGLQIIVIRVRELARRAIELDFLQGTQRDGAGRQIILGILPFLQPAHVLLPRLRKFWVQDRPPGFSRLRQGHYAAMHGGTGGTSEVGRAAGVDVLVTAAGAVDLLLDRLDGGVVVGGGDRLERPPRARRVPEAAGGSRSGKRIGALRRCLTPRRYDAKKSPRTEHQELTPVDVQRSVVASGDAHFPSSTKRTEYPACARFAAGEPPGHMTISPPSATIIPPYHTHHTSGLMVNRNTACSVPFTTPPSTT